MTTLQRLGTAAAVIGILSAAPAFAQDIPADAANFYTSDKVVTQPVTFRNQYRTSPGISSCPRGWIKTRSTPRSSWGIPWAR